MGRKPKSMSPPIAKPSVVGVQLEPENFNPSLEKVDSNPESTNPVPVRVESQPEKLEMSVKSASKKMARNSYERVRRSKRLQNPVTDTQNHDLERIIKDIVLSESEQEDEPADRNARNLEEKVEQLVQLLQAQQVTLDTLKSKVIKKISVGESSCMGDVTYKSLYINSQKKVEALLEENLQLTKKLENALGKIEYEKGSQVAYEVMEKLKNVLLFSSVTKATEATAAANLSSEAIHGAFTDLDANLESKTTYKRKKSK